MAPFGLSAGPSPEKSLDKPFPDDPEEIQRTPKQEVLTTAVLIILGSNIRRKVCL